MPRTLVVIVNYRTAALVVDCLRSLAGEPDREVRVVDNASGDDSISVLNQAIADNGWTWASILPFGRNAGFSAGNNAAIRECLRQSHPPEYVWLLNPDTLVRPGAIAELTRFLDDHPTVGIAGGGLENPDGSPQTAAFRFPSLAGELEDSIRISHAVRALSRFQVPLPPRSENHPCDWVNGASMMVRREVFDDIGLMDEGFFLYFEETDFCRRAKTAGWDVWHVASSRVIHLEGQSTGVTGANLARKRRPKYWFDSRARYHRKHGRAGWLADLLWIAAFGQWRIQRWLRGKQDPDPPHLWGDFVRHALRRHLR